MEATMKKVLVVAVGLILILALAASAQETAAKKMSFSIKGGVSMGTLTGDSLKNFNLDFSKKSRLGFAGGVGLGFAVAKNFTIQPELLYVMKGAKFESGSEKITYKTDVIELPVLLKFTPEMKGSKIMPTIFVGPFVSMKMTGKVKAEGFTDVAENVEIDIKDSLKSTDFGVTFGGGFGYKMAKGELFFDVRYDLGLSKVVKKEAFGNADFDTKTGTFLALVGYKFEI